MSLLADKASFHKLALRVRLAVLCKVLRFRLTLFGVFMDSFVCAESSRAGDSSLPIGRGSQLGGRVLRVCRKRFIIAFEC